MKKGMEDKNEQLYIKNMKAKIKTTPAAGLEDKVKSSCPRKATQGQRAGK